MDNKDFDMNRYDYGETGGYEGPYAGDNYSNQSADNGLVGIDPTTSAANNTNVLAIHKWITFVPYHEQTETGKILVKRA